MQLLIKPVSSSCNLACAYCFYLDRHGDAARKPVKAMGQEVVKTMVKSFLEIEQEVHVFSWQGGEPTLAGLHFFRRVVDLQARLGRSGQRIGNTLQTNGILLNAAWCRFLSECRFLVGLSLDGPEAVHDIFRLSPAGVGSHAAGLRALACLKEHQVAFSVLVAVHRHSRGGEIYDWLRNEGISSFQFIPVVERDPATGDVAPFSLPPDGYGEFMCEVFDRWWPERDAVSVRDFESIALKLAGCDPPMCLFGSRCDSYLVVEADGLVYPCDFFVKEEWCLGDVRLTSLRDLHGSEKHVRFARQKSSFVPSCEGCAWAELCAGGCLKDRERNGDLGGPTYLCSGYKTLFAHALPRLREYLRESTGQGPAPATGA